MNNQIGLNSGSLGSYYNSDGKLPTEDDVVAAAEEVETQRRVVNTLWKMREPTDLREKIRAAGWLRLEQNKLNLLEGKYDETFERWVRGGCK